MNRIPLALAAPLLIFGCGQDGASDRNAAALDLSAGPGDPDADDILRNAAEPGGDVEAQGKAKAP